MQTISPKPPIGSWSIGWMHDLSSSPPLGSGGYQETPALHRLAAVATKNRWLSDVFCDPMRGNIASDAKAEKPRATSGHWRF
ncbi:MAG: hypothetical protein ACK5PD_06770 [Pirellulaceae bacterium]